MAELLIIRHRSFLAHGLHLIVLSTDLPGLSDATLVVGSSDVKCRYRNRVGFSSPVGRATWLHASAVSQDGPIQVRMVDDRQRSGWRGSSAPGFTVFERAAPSPDMRLCLY